MQAGGVNRNLLGKCRRGERWYQLGKERGAKQVEVGAFRNIPRRLRGPLTAASAFWLRSFSCSQKIRHKRPKREGREESWEQGGRNQCSRLQGPGRVSQEAGLTQAVEGPGFGPVLSPRHSEDPVAVSGFLRQGIPV